ncbi:hydrolase 1, exosortase A system-associated [Hydrogenophaga intermedia]|uniref:hydrolase 1, exosortase A system-associated n=1 Tax=Hydrogenophaga intermedia TaxID=65786 RepID=UPI002044646A|nr:hydrolase 1, exosortase A system-associated [Hydrogenophaga intermedia]
MSPASPAAAAPAAADQPLAIGSPAGPLLGLLSQPAADAPARDIGMLIVPGGAQYRVGAHRQFRELAHELAAAGYPTLRFDLPGQGDSPGEPLPYTAIGPCLQAAGNALLQASPAACRRIAVFGLCDGASAALLHAHACMKAQAQSHAQADGQAHPQANATSEPTWAGIAMLNPWLEPDAQVQQARERHYYRQRLFSRALWRQLFSGGLGMASVRAALRSAMGSRASPPGGPANASVKAPMNSPTNGPPVLQPADVNAALAQAWVAWPGQLLLIVGGADLSGQTFDHQVQHHPAWRSRRPAARWQRVLLPGADHTLSRNQWRIAARDALLAWLACQPALQSDVGFFDKQSSNRT